MSPAEQVVARIRAKVTVTENGCWLFTGCLVRGGYGQIRAAGRGVYVHRAMYEATHGPIPEGLQIDHLCRIRNCCRPEHLEAVPLAVNAARTPPGQRGRFHGAIESAKTHCPAQHPYDDANTYVSRAGHRRCRACQRARYHARKGAPR